MYIYNFFEILEIEPTNDKKKIKKAYSELVKKYHPEEFPEEWKKIRDAYKTAMSYAERATINVSVLEDDLELEYQQSISKKTLRADEILSDKVDMQSRVDDILPDKASIPSRVDEILSDNADIPSRVDDIVLDKAGISSDSDEMLSMFENINDLATNQKIQIQNQIKEKCILAVRKLAELSKTNNVNKWEEFFNQQDMDVLSQETFLYELSDVMLRIKFNRKLDQLFRKQIKSIKRYCVENNIIHERHGLFAPLESVEVRLSYKDADTPKRERKEIRIGPRGKVVMVLFVLRLIFSNPFEDTSPEINNMDYAYETNLIIQASNSNIKYTPVSDGIEARQSMQLVLNELALENRAFTENRKDILNNAAILKDGICVIKMDSQTVKNSNDYEYKKITDINEIGNLEGVNLEGKDFFAIQIWTKDKTHIGAVGVNFEKYGIDTGCKIYYVYDEGYDIIAGTAKEMSGIGVINRYWMANHWFIPVEIPNIDEGNGVKLIFVDE